MNYLWTYLDHSRETVKFLRGIIAAKVILVKDVTDESSVELYEINIKRNKLKNLSEIYRV